MKQCPECMKMCPPTHFYGKSGKSRCVPHLKWPMARRWKVMELIERGKSNAEIATSVGATEAAVMLMRKRYKLETTKHSSLTARQVAVMMGIGCAKTVVRWIEEGFLKGKQGYRQGPHHVWFVKPDSLRAFIADESTWHVWTQERIADKGLRKHAEDVRRGVRFLTPGEVAWDFYVEHGAINDWIHKGIIPARRWGNWWIDERDVVRLKQERGVA